ncbi:MAG TPA: hypothetical protein VID72_08425 [Ktedonobacterales bacterium]
MAQGSSGVRAGVMAQRPDPVQARIAPYTGKSSLFLFGGISLILANLLLTQQGWTIATALLPAAPKAPASATNTSLLGLAGQVVILGALLLVGSVSDEGATFALLFLAALWLGFFYHHRDLLSGLLSQATPGTPGATSPASSSAAPGSTTPTNAWLQP